MCLSGNPWAKLSLHIISEWLTFCRYKFAGANAVDASGELDTVEFLNVAKDDALAWPTQARRDYPRTANARMESTIVPFVRKSLEVNNTILEIFNDKLGLPAGSLLKRHSMEEFSGSEARITRNGPTTNTTKVAIGSHTDFGSLVISLSLTKSPWLIIMFLFDTSPSFTTDWVASRCSLQVLNHGNISRSASTFEI